MSQPQWWLGIDLGSAKHQASLLDGRGKQVKQFEFTHDGKGLAHLLEVLSQVTGGRLNEVAAAMETNQGMVCEVLVEQVVEVYSLNPKQLDRFRDRHTVAGAKDDRLDAFVLADSLRTDTHLFRRVEPLSAWSARLRELTRTLEEETGDFRSQANRLWSLLLRYYPVLLQMCSGLDEGWLWELFHLAETPVQAAQLTRGKLKKLLDKHRIRRLTGETLAQLLQNQGVSGDPETAAICAEHAKMVLSRMEESRRRILELEGKIKELVEPPKPCPPKGKRHRQARRKSSAPSPDQAGPAAVDAATAPTVPARAEPLADGESTSADLSAAPARSPEMPPKLTDCEIVFSMKGFGWKTTAIFLGEAAREIAHADYASLRGRCGVAPVTRRSGKSLFVMMRRACDHRLRNAIHHAANVAYQHVPAWGLIYARCRSHGGTHNRALRQVGDRMLNVLCVMLLTRTLFDPAKLRNNPGHNPDSQGTTLQKIS